MKKQKANPQSKSAAVRQYKAEHPRAKPKEIVAALAARGIVVTPGHASAALTLDRQRKARKSQPGDTLAMLLIAKRFVGRVGGIERARQLLRVLEILAL